LPYLTDEFTGKAEAVPPKAEKRVISFFLLSLPNACRCSFCLSSPQAHLSSTAFGPLEGEFGESVRPSVRLYVCIHAFSKVLHSFVRVLAFLRELLVFYMKNIYDCGESVCGRESERVCRGLRLSYACIESHGFTCASVPCVDSGGARICLSEEKVRGGGMGSVSFSFFVCVLLDFSLEMPQLGGNKDDFLLFLYLLDCWIVCMCRHPFSKRRGGCTDDGWTQSGGVAWPRRIHSPELQANKTSRPSEIKSQIYLDQWVARKAGFAYVHGQDL